MRAQTWTIPVGRVVAARGELIRFAGVGAVCTLLYLALFVAFRVVAGAQLANLAALLLSAVANTALNRRFTFRLAGRTAAGEHVRGLVAFAIGAGLTAVALAVLDRAHPHPAITLELAVLLAAAAVATVARYVMFRWWVFTGALGRR